MDKSSSSSSSPSPSPSPSLEITIISAEDLRINRRLIHKNAFVTVETDSRNSQSTSVDRDGGSYPSWEQKLQLPLPYNIKHIRVQVKCKIAAGVKNIGSVSIPLTDILEDYTPPHCVHFLSYRLRDGKGERNGIVNLSVRMNGGQRYVQATAGYINTSRVAMGIPVTNGYKF